MRLLEFALTPPEINWEVSILGIEKASDAVNNFQSSIHRGLFNADAH